jgi:hypothetical protein
MRKGRVTVTTKESRSGETKGHVRIVLIASTPIVIIGFIVVLAIRSQG